MGDRNNPIKFGPEWLRNLARERNASIQGSNSQNALLASGNGSNPGPGSPAPARAASPVSGNPLCSANMTQKIHLAKLRYGREEMLALYDRTVEAPAELKSIDQLYQPRGKPPFALHNTFEEEMRENLRSGPPMGALTPDKYGRGMGRGLTATDNRGRPRMPFVRQPSLGRGATFHQRIPGYVTGADEDAPPLPRSWSNSNGGPSTNRTVNEQSEWTPNKTFRSKRPTNNTNWRSPQTREEGEEWRLSDPGRPRASQQDKWERDWGDRPNQDKPPSWNHNRRTWGGDAQNEEILPEWAMDNAEACAGTFDASGAFHGYSNDDTNLPRSQEASYSLTRSHTHGSFARLKSVEDGSEEWWASAKAKKLSPKKFDASEIKFKKQVSVNATEDSGNTSSSSKQSSTSKEESNMTPDAQENQVTSPDSSDSGQPDNTYSKDNAYRPKYSENKTFDALMRSDINMDEASDRGERGNFQSVTIKPNNSLRQKHQNIVALAADNPTHQVRKAGILPGMQDVIGQMPDKEHSKLSGKSPEDTLVDDMFEISLDEKDLLSKLPSVIGALNTGMSGKVPMGNSATPLSNPAMQNRAVSPSSQNQGSVMHTPNLSMPAMPGMHSTTMHTLGMQSSATKAPGLQSPGMHPHGLLTSTVHPGIQSHGLPSPGAQQSGMPSPSIQNSGLQTLGLQTSGQNNAGMQSPGMQSSNLQTLGLQTSVPKNSGMPSPGIQTQGLQVPGMPSHGLQMPGMQAPGMQGISLQSLGMQSAGMQPGLQNTANQTSSIHNIGISNTALNSAMRLQGPRLLEQGPATNSMGIPHQRMTPPPLLLNPNMVNSAMNASGMHQGSTGLTGFQNSSAIQGMPNTSSSIFGLGQNPNNAQIPPSSDIQMPNHAQNNMFPMHGLQHSGSQAPFNSLYGNMNMMRQSPPHNAPNSQSLADHWYYEDPKKTVQGPFSSKDMYNWYRAGFFTPSLMVRRACDTHMRPLGSYGSVVPFAQVEMASFSMSGGFGMRNQGSHDSMINTQPGLGLDVIPNVNVGDNSMDNLQFGTVGLVRNQPFGQPQMVDSLWGQPSTSPDLMWMQQTMNARSDMRVNLPMFFWDQQSSVTSNSMLPEEIVKEMKTEDQILAQLRASQSTGAVPNMPFMSEQSHAPAAAAGKPADGPGTMSATPNLEELHKLMQKDTLLAKSDIPETRPDTKDEGQSKSDKTNKLEHSFETVKANESLQTKQQDSKQAKPNKAEIEKATKNKENKTKVKKAKEEKKDEGAETAKEEDSNKAETKSEDSSPSKSKKEDKLNKKELEKEKKEWIKEGFTIVKGPEKAPKDKKKADEVKLNDEVERKRLARPLMEVDQKDYKDMANYGRKEEEKLAADEEKKIKLAEALKKQQEQRQQQREESETIIKKAPWSAAANLAQQATTKDGLSLAEIQRLEREKKLEQMKEQQQMMQVIAQQQAAALAREQEMQANLGWAKKKLNPVGAGLSLAEIQAEARKQSAAAAAAVAVEAAAQVLEEAVGAASANHVPWGNAHNGGGFWDSPATALPPKPVEKPQEPQRVMEHNVKPKKKNTLNIPAKKEASPGAEFDTWCNTVLASWSAKIDVPTFVGFLKDIESPYEVKDYVKCYLGETKESSDFARQFLEKRSKLLRVGMVTPSDDLCSPAVAVNPRTPSGSDYQEGKGKKTKKNKMLKVDARILGFSVTASEDRINVGDIDTV